MKKNFLTSIFIIWLIFLATIATSFSSNIRGNSKNHVWHRDSIASDLMQQFGDEPVAMTRDEIEPMNLWYQGLRATETYDFIDEPEIEDSDFPEMQRFISLTSSFPGVIYQPMGDFEDHIQYIHYYRTAFLLEHVIQDKQWILRIHIGPKPTDFAVYTVQVDGDNEVESIQYRNPFEQTSVLYTDPISADGFPLAMEQPFLWQTALENSIEDISPQIFPCVERKDLENCQQKRYLIQSGSYPGIVEYQFIDGELSRKVYSVDFLVSEVSYTDGLYYLEFDYHPAAANKFVEFKTVGQLNQDTNTMDFVDIPNLQHEFASSLLPALSLFWSVIYA